MLVAVSRSAGRSQRGQFDDLYAETYPMVWAYVRRRVNSVEDAEDLVVEVFATAWRRSDDLERADSSVAWLLGIARNLILNHRRRSRRQSLLLDKMRRT